MADVLIVGAGPAGWALAAACARRGLRTVLAAPDPGRRWPATYGLWADEVADFPESAIAAAPGTALAYGTREHRLGRRYLVVDNDSLAERLAVPGIGVLAGLAVAATHDRHGSTVRFADGRERRAGVVVDASGARRALSGAPPPGVHTEQTAYGLVLPADAARALVPADTAVFMDWRGNTGADQTFLYSLPLGDGTVLVEETSLARRPGLGLDVLAARLRDRLARAGVPAGGREERVRVPLDLPFPKPRRVLPFGVAAGFVHPATGYSVATALALAPRLAATLAETLPHGPLAASAAAYADLWSPAALAVHRLRAHALRALRGLPPERVPEFFDLFFAMPVEAQRAFTSGREDLAGLSAAMLRLFRAAPWRIRRHLFGWSRAQDSGIAV
ncbi:lycopene cyclase family protein [Amycolatopsis samaneae]|uniref:Lycopene cyclase family protein n=1 Tax=Amycolatopsis samaneae TaxID=664691 RepID=A0ABW5GRW6_9PSEU